MTRKDKKQPDPVRAPKQNRSKATLERILDSARRAIEEKSFDEATLSEVVEGAGVTVGAFYARFPDKAALLRLLEQEAYDDLGAALTDAPAITSTPTRPAQIVRTLLSEVARTYREHRGAIRTILVQSRADSERQRRRMDFTSEFVRKGITQLQAAASILERPPSARAWRIALLFALSALRDAIVFDEDWWAETKDDDDAVLVTELTAAVLAYLQIPGD